MERVRCVEGPGWWVRLVGGSTVEFSHTSASGEARVWGWVRDTGLVWGAGGMRFDESFLADASETVALAEVLFREWVCGDS